MNFSDDTSIALQIEIRLSESEGCCGGIPRLESFQINEVLQERTNGFYTIGLDQ